MKFPIGIEDYKEIKNLGYYYVDKTKIIEEFDSIKNVFFIRPRRFGKSLTLSMLDTFYGQEFKADFNKYFRGTYIYNKIDKLIYQPNHFEIIRLNFKQVINFETYLGYKRKITYSVIDTLVDKSIQELYLEKDKYGLGDVIKLIINPNKQYIFLIDEYDTAVNYAIGAKKFELVEDILDDMKSLYLILKGNPNIAKTIVTGINKLGKSGLFSGGNQFKDITFTEGISQLVGFTEEEVFEMIKLQGIGKIIEENKLKEFYNGYQFDKQKGSKTIYNPFSILNFIDNKGDFDMYWSGSGTYRYMQELVWKLQEENKEEFNILKYNLENLINKEEIDINFEELGLNFEVELLNKNIVLKLLLFTGYLTLGSGGLVIANKETMHEIIGFYGKILGKEGLIRRDMVELLNDFVGHLRRKKFTTIYEDIENLIQTVLKFRMIYYLKEQAYVMILASVLGFQTYYTIEIKKESGEGYADMIMYPYNPEEPGYIFEFKRLKSKEKIGNKRDLIAKAVMQIKSKYEGGLKQGITWYYVGVVLKGKRVIALEIVDKNTDEKVFVY